MPRMKLPICGDALLQLCSKLNLQRPGTMLYFDVLEILQPFTDFEIGQMIIALLEYAKTGERRKFTDRGMEAVMIALYHKADLDGEAWAATVLQNRYANECKLYKAQNGEKPTYLEWLMTQARAFNLPGYNLLPANRQLVPIEAQHTTTAPNITSASTTVPSATAATDRDIEFAQIWAAYPKHVNRDGARKAFDDVDVSTEMLLEAIAKQRKSDQWTRDGGKYIPNPDKWLRERRWTDELPRNQAGYIQHDDPPSPYMLATIKEMLSESDDNN